MQIFSEEEFWAFSLAFYGVEENKKCLLWLQDNVNLNVNLLLFAIYSVDQGFLVTNEQFLSLNRALVKVEKETEELRKARILIGQEDKTSEAYKHALSLELEHEKIQQKKLVESVQTLGQLYSFSSKLPQKILEEHLYMLFSELLGERLGECTAYKHEQFIAHSRKLVRNYLCIE